MGFDSVVEEAVETTLAAQLRPIDKRLSALEAVISKLASVAGSITQAVPTKVRGRPGRRPAAAKAATHTPKVTKEAKKRSRAVSHDRACGVMGCPEEARSKGYCSNHYQKFNLMRKRGIAPSDWVEFPVPGSVANVNLPRGRSAGHTPTNGKAMPLPAPATAFPTFPVPA